VRYAAAFFATSSALVYALLALFVERSMYGWVRSPWLRWLVAVMSVLAPVAFLELNANIANLTWPLTFAAFWAMASRRTGSIDVGLRAGVVALAALSTPAPAVLLPWGAAIAIARRHRDDFIVLGTTVVALALQGIAMLATSPLPSTDSAITDLPTEYGVRVGASFVFGERWLGQLWRHLGSLGLMTVVAVGIIVALIASTLPWRISSERRWFAAGSIALSLAMFAVPVWARGTGGFVLVVGGEFNAVGSRHAFLPLLLLLSAIAVLADGSDLRRWLIPTLTVHSVVLMILCFNLSSARSGGPGWAAAVRSAEQRCRESPGLATVAVPITPDSPPGWVTTVPCDRLR
jgi:hypothetical protein